MRKLALIGLLLLLSKPVNAGIVPQCRMGIQDDGTITTVPSDAPGLLQPTVFLEHPVTGSSHPMGEYDEDLQAYFPVWPDLTYIIEKNLYERVVDVTLTLPETRVFESGLPHLVDLDLDGNCEIIVVESDVERGSQVAIYHYDFAQNALVKVASTPHLGRRNRFLSPYGGADLDGDGAIEIAYVDQDQLHIWRFENGALHHVTYLEGVSEHHPKERTNTISGGIRDCGDGLEIITANADWSQIMAVRLENDELTARPLFAYEGPHKFAWALACLR